MTAARRASAPTLECSLDLKRTQTTVALQESTWLWNGTHYPYLGACRPRTIYGWFDSGFQAIARYGSSLVKLVPTDWGAPTFEIDGIKMLPTSQMSPYEDAERKVALVRPRDKVILDTCGGMGYFADWCLRGQARHVYSFEKNPDVLWLRKLNPWSPAPGVPGLTLEHADVTGAVSGVASGSIDVVLHDPPRFGTAGELYSQDFYAELARVLKRRGLLFHYTGSPNKVAIGRDLSGEVAKRLKVAGMTTAKAFDGILATKR